MGKAIEALYEHGVFRPLEPVEIEEGRRVLLSVRSEDDTGERFSTDLHEWQNVYAGLTEAEVEEVERLATDRSQFSRYQNEE